MPTRHVFPTDFTAFLGMFVKWLLLGGGIGILAGTASAVFLASLDWATAYRLGHPAIVFLLPVAGLLLGWVYHRYGGAAAQGTTLIIEEVHSNSARIPLRMTPLILVGTVMTHLFGGSAGREGTAIQMGASLADTLRRVLRLKGEDRRLMLMAGISGGFGSVFGTPLAGFVFCMEVQSVGRVRYEGMIPCLVAALVGDLVTRAWGIGHSHYPTLPTVATDAGLLLRVALAGVSFGLTSIAFIELTHAIKRLGSRLIAYSPLRPFVGGVLVIGLALLSGTQDYLGLSLPLIGQSLSGAGVEPLAFLFKLVFTALTLGMGFVGGEVTPLFVIGSTFGFTLGGTLGVEPTLLAAIGFVAVFGGASNTPLACTLMGIELFGSGAAVYLVVGCVIAYLTSGHRSIYASQRIGAPKSGEGHIQADERVAGLSARQGVEKHG